MQFKSTFLFLALMGLASSCLASFPEHGEVPCGSTTTGAGAVTFIGSGPKISEEFLQNSLCGKMPISSKPILNIAYTIYPSVSVMSHSPTMIFINGGPGMANYLRSEAFSELLLLRLHYNLVFYDQRGTGSSLLSAEDSLNCKVVNTQKNIDDLRELIQRISPNEPVELFSHSYGVEIALRFAAQYPDSVSKIIATSSSGDLGFMRDELLQGQPITSLWDAVAKQYSRWDITASASVRQESNRDKQEALEHLWPILKTIESKNISIDYNGEKEKLLEPMLYTALKSAAGDSIFDSDLLKSVELGMPDTFNYISNILTPGTSSVLVNNTIVCDEFLPALTKIMESNVSLMQSQRACRELRPVLCTAKFPVLNINSIRAKVYFVYGDQDPKTKKQSIDTVVSVNPRLFYSVRVSGNHNINLSMLKTAQQQQPQLFSFDIGQASEAYLH